MKPSPSPPPLAIRLAFNRGLLCAGVLLAAQPIAAQVSCDTAEMLLGFARGAPGDLVEVVVSGTATCEVSGFSLAVGHETSRLTFVEATPGPYLAGVAGDSLYFEVNDRSADGFVAVLLFLDILPPLEVLPVIIPPETPILTLSYRISDTAPGGRSQLVNRTLFFGDQIPVANVYAGRPGEPPIEPRLADGFVSIPGPPGSFLRGDANTDGFQDLADALVILFHLFTGAPPLQCDRSADADDSGSLELTDAIALLQALFGGGDSLPAPTGSCGLDTTPDGLTCGAFDACE